uniref:Uncharacterized protein n=1 Tax=Timema cristinae TaxID=61476 RepID=A0A7R9GRH5_TIMCR|nr:unnamed protein product [Timema cristinae]
MVVTSSEPDTETHCAPTVRLCEVARGSGGSCGFHLSRTQWDPYPWVSGVEGGTAAEVAGLAVGDCVLEVNGEDVLGQRIGQVADKVRARAGTLSLLLWNPGSDPTCQPESLCCGPMPTNLQRLSTSMSAILAALECPVCLDTIPPPAHQCGNGHLICVQCRVRTERCPVCRMRFCRGRSLLADQVFNSLTEAFELKSEPEETRPAKLRERLFGNKKKQQQGQPKTSPPAPEMKVSLITSPTNKFLSRIMGGKSSSVENLSSSGGNHHLSAVPRHLADARFDPEFASDLKAKSLSTGEIFQAGTNTAPVSRSTSINSHGSGLLSVGRYLGNRRPASYHGSCESIDHHLEDEDFSKGERGITATLTCFCPCDADCPDVIKSSRVLRHVQECHDGPLVQYFKSKVTLSLPFPLEDSSVLSIVEGGDTFFLKIAQQQSTVSSDPGDTLIWLWLVGGELEAGRCQMRLTLKGHGTLGKVLQFESRAVSLCSMPWSEVCQSGEGVRLTAETLISNFATELEAGIPIKMVMENGDRDVLMLGYTLKACFTVDLASMRNVYDRDDTRARFGNAFLGQTKQYGYDQ